MGQTQSAAAPDAFAHFMVQNSYAYDGGQWSEDIKAAKAIGIAGFVLNWVPPRCDANNNLDWQMNRIDDAYAVASLLDFKMVQSFDMSYTVCDQYWTPAFMSNRTLKYANYNAAYYWSSNLLVTTFAGDSSRYGESFFEQLKGNATASGTNITLAPALLTYSYEAQTNATQAAQQLTADYPSIDGYMNWQAWPLDVKANVTTTVDSAFKSQLSKAGRKGPYMMGVSPWQYKDLNDNNSADAWVQYSDYLYPTRWTSLVGPNAFRPDIIQLLTWNDWAESHYIRKLPSQNSSSTDYSYLGETSNYIYGSDHTAWQAMTKYYTIWLKNGSAPTNGTDQVVLWHRIHPKGIPCTGGSSTQIRNSQYPDDAIFYWVAVSNNATIEIDVGSEAKSFDVVAYQPVVGSLPFPSEVYSGTSVLPIASIKRGGSIVYSNASGQHITNSCAYQNYNPEVFLVGNT